MIELTLDYEERVSQIEKYLVFIWISDNRSLIKDLKETAEEKVILDDDSEIILKDFLINGSDFLIDTELIKILKSNTILLFYNLIEGTINSIMNEYFGIINNDNSAFKEYELPIKRIWLKYKHKSFGVGDQKKDDYIISTIESILEEIVEINPKSIKDSELGTKQIHNYDAYSAETKTNDISGNLDARKIRQLFSLYGLPEIKLECNSMLKVKTKEIVLLMAMRHLHK